MIPCLSSTPRSVRRQTISNRPQSMLSIAPMDPEGEEICYELEQMIGGDDDEDEDTTQGTYRMKSRGHWMKWHVVAQLRAPWNLWLNSLLRWYLDQPCALKSYRFILRNRDHHNHRDAHIPFVRLSSRWHCSQAQGTFGGHDDNTMKRTHTSRDLESMPHIAIANQRWRWPAYV